MDKTEFKTKWNLKRFESWTDFDPAIFDSSNLLERTKEFLKGGFPNGAAPFLNFDLENSDGKLKNIAEYYSNQEQIEGTENYWVFGSDGAGNPICIDSSSNDKILLLDHELGFQPIEHINKDVIELAYYLLEFRNFISDIQTEFGENGFFDSKFTKLHLDGLKERLEKINHNIFSESDFWKREIESLYEEIE